MAWVAVRNGVFAAPITGTPDCSACPGRPGRAGRQGPGRRSRRSPAGSGRAGRQDRVQRREFAQVELARLVGRDVRHHGDAVAGQAGEGRAGRPRRATARASPEGR
jgi:hypothetical protein